jgi:enoyl-CoA hydratase/carnithine racemase
METPDGFLFETKELKTYLKEEVAVIKIKGNVFGTITDLAESGKFLSLIDIAEKKPDIKALFLINEAGSYGEDEYDKFLRKVLGKEEEETKRTDEGEGTLIPKDSRIREINILNRVITHLVEFKKICVMGQQGNIVTPFFGAGLAADFRYAAEDVSYSLYHLKYGVHPGGALPFFLPRYVGHSKAVEILFRREKMTAQEALDLGLVTAIFPKDDFENRCIEEIKKLCQLDLRVINHTKLLINFSRAELRDYFDIEAALLH